MEVPSQFLEYFIHDYRYLAQFSKHYLSSMSTPHTDCLYLPCSPLDAVLPSSLLSCTTRHLHILSGMEFQKQVYESILDLTIHSGNVEDLTQIAEKLHPIYMNEGSCEGLMWHAKFGHFISYVDVKRVVLIGTLVMGQFIIVTSILKCTQLIFGSVASQLTLSTEKWDKNTENTCWRWEEQNILNKFSKT